MKKIKKNQRKVGTTAKKKEKRNRKLNKYIMELEEENKELKRRLKNCVCPHCGYGFEQI